MTTAAEAATNDPGFSGILRGPRVLVVGAGERLGIPAAVGDLGSSVLVCTDERMSAEPVLTTLCDGLRSRGVRVTLYTGVQAELPEDSIRACVDEVRSAEPDVVLGIGGGSCIDHAKVTSLLLAHGGRPADYYGENRVPGDIVPVVAVPTTAGTGAEATPVAVLTDSSRPMKVGISSPHLIPHTAIVDPTLTAGCPSGLTASTGADALTHCVESYTAIRRGVEPGVSSDRVFVGAGALTDQYALSGIGLIGRSLLRAVQDGSYEPAREDMSVAALYGGLALGTAGTAAAHAIQYPVGAMTHTAHGLGVGLLLPYVMEFNLPTRVIEMTRVAIELGALDARSAAPTMATKQTARVGIEAVAGLLAAAGIPTSLQELGLQRSDLAEVVTLSLMATRLVENNPRELSPEACSRIVEAAFHGDRELLREHR
jgi:alcohol dehydrogenase class IV